MHCRQFPHFAGLGDQEIRRRVRAELAARPALLVVIRLRGVIVMSAALATFTLLDALGVRVLPALAAATVAAALAWIGWNLVWTNQVLWRITKA